MAFDFTGLTYGELIVLAHPMVDIANKIVILNKYYNGDLFALTPHEIKRIMESDEIQKALNEYIEFGDTIPEIPDVFNEIFSGGNND